MKSRLLFAALALLLAGPSAFAQSVGGAFEIVDLTGQVEGAPELSLDSARRSWTEACGDWKNETKALNKNNELMGINCNTPTCTQLEYGKNQCRSTGTYQVKTAGTRVAPVQTVVQAPPPPIVTSEPAPVQQIIVEEPPPPRVGYLWVPGYWGWAGHRHLWYRGYWRHRFGSRW